MIYRAFSATLLVLLLMMKLAQAQHASNWSYDWQWMEWCVEGPNCHQPAKWWEYLPDNREYRTLIPAFCKVYVRKDQVVASPLGGYHYLSDCGCECHVDTVLSDCDGLYILLIPRNCPYCGGFCHYYNG